MGRTKGASLSSAAPALGRDDDPLLRALAPPVDESPDARAARQRAENQAKKRSDEIDARLQAENAARRKRGQAIKVLLLGQSESGKSTTLKNFQLTYARKQWVAEKEAWRAVIQLNLVRSINSITFAVARELNDPASIGLTPEALYEPENDPNADNASILTIEHENGKEEHEFGLTDEHRALIVRLSVLRGVQRNLESKLGSGAEELGYEDGTTRVDLSDPVVLDTVPEQANPKMSFRDITNSHSTTTTSIAPGSYSKVGPLRSRRSQEFFVRSQGWKSTLQRLRGRSSRTSRDSLSDADPDSAAIARAAGDMRALWQDHVVREIVRARKVRLMDCSEFFLDDVERVASIRYTPSDDDVIRARLRTVGVQEHSLMIEAGPEPGREWLIYDVGGCRTQRAQWPAYFDDVHAIIFLAPINCFDERLAEDQRVNRIDDSMQLWKLVCSNKLLAKTELVLFLNKCDLLEKKLQSGVRFADYVKSYRDGQNDAAHVSKFLRGKFMDVCRHYSKEHRGLHIHFTSVIDTKATAQTLAAVQDGILRSNLRNLDLI